MTAQSDSSPFLGVNIRLNRLNPYYHNIENLQGLLQELYVNSRDQGESFLEWLTRQTEPIDVIARRVEEERENSEGAHWFLNSGVATPEMDNKEFYHHLNQEYAWIYEG